MLKKVLLVVAALVVLVSARAVLACTADSDCATGQVCQCDTNAPTPSGPSACGSTEVIPGVLEISGAANQNGANGCIEIAETVTLSGGSASVGAPPSTDHAACEAASNSACIANGCGVCGTQEP